MESLADGLPPEIAALVHPAWRQNEACYWAARDGLLADCEGQWVAFAGGAVIAQGTSPLEVFHLGQASGLHPYIVRAGAEWEPCAMRNNM